jgi:hypothetical protein
MSELYQAVDFDQIPEGTPILGFAVHVLSWKFNEWGQPRWGLVPVSDNEVEKLRVELAEAQETIKDLKAKLDDSEHHSDFYRAQAEGL